MGIRGAGFKGQLRLIVIFGHIRLLRQRGVIRMVEPISQNGK